MTTKTDFERAAAALIELPDVARAWLAPIHDDEQLENALEAEEFLGRTIAGNLNHPLAPIYAGLIEKITAYERETYCTETTPPHRMLEFLMEQKGIRQSELAESLQVHQSNVSRMINGQKAFTTDLVKQLGMIFNVPPTVFMG